MKKIKWIKRGQGGGEYCEPINGVYLSFQPNDMSYELRFPKIDSFNPETAIVFKNDKADGGSRCLIYRGDWRKELSGIFPDKDKLKEHWKKHGGHFWSDNLED